MPYSFELLDSHAAPVASMVICTVFFSLYWFLFISPAFKKRCTKAKEGDGGLIMHILRLKYAGLLILGIIPVGIFLILFPKYSLSDLGIGFNPETAGKSLMWIGTLASAALLFNWFAARRRKIFNMYPQIRVKHWDTRLMTQYASGWVIYMLGYEMLFRGLLLFPLADGLGVWPAIAINVVLYMSSHIPKGADETFASLFFGPLMCYVTLSTGTIWAAWIIHSILVVSNSMVSLRFHPEFVIVGRRNEDSGQLQKTS